MYSNIDVFSTCLKDSDLVTFDESSILNQHMGRLKFFLCRVKPMMWDEISISTEFAKFDRAGSPQNKH